MNSRGEFGNWKGYWDNYLFHKHAKQEVQTEDDLFFQVARTVNRKPISDKAFRLIIETIQERLELNTNDILVDMCCGNGLFTYELHNDVKKIIGIDFSSPIIEAANKFKSSENISYCLGSVVEFLQNFHDYFPDLRPNKYLMNDSIAYFSPADFENILTSICNISPEHFKCLFRGAPAEDLKWNFYNTEERKQRYYHNIETGDLTNDGLGRWWQQEEITGICEKLGLRASITTQHPTISDYRVDIEISR